MGHGMNALDLHSETFAPTGGVDAEGIRNQLGRPEFDPWALVVREAIQNACDARDPVQGGVRVDFQWRALSPPEHRVLDALVLAERAPALDSGWRARTSETRVLVIADRGTVGLTGPTRADQPSGDNAERRFVGLLRNVGQPPQRLVSGGSFGFGKAAFYVLSRSQTAIIHSRWRRPDGRLESRFMAAAVGHRATVNGRLLTGRHWWGRMAKDEIVEPLVNTEADATAARLGLPPFNGLDTGTTIAVLDPDLGSWAPDEVGDMLREAILWNYWPVMLAPKPGQPPPARFSIALEGAAATPIAPEREPLLQSFIRACQHASAQLDTTATARTGMGSQVHSIRSKGSRIAALGLTVAPTWRRPGQAVIERLKSLGGPDLESGLHHVALMRRPRFVVRYEPGPNLPDDTAGYAGACVVADEADEGFKRAEDQTHNRWVHHHLTDLTEQQWVKSLFSAIRKHTKALVEPREEAPTETTSSAALGPLAAALGTLLQAATKAHEPAAGRNRKGSVTLAEPPPAPPPGDPGLSREQSPTGEGATEAGAEVRPPEKPMGKPTVRPGEGRLDIWNGEGVLRIPLTVTRGVRAAGFEVSVTARVALDQGLEKEAPIGAELPTVLAWLDPEGNVEAGAEGTRRWPECQSWKGAVLIKLLDDAAIEPVIDAASIAPEVAR